MDNNRQSINPEINFTNDQLAEWVLHKDDPRELNDDEIANDQDIAVEGAVDVGQIINNGIRFPIHFVYNGSGYSADVRKAWTTTPEYDITAVTPSIPYLPECFVVTTPAREKFDFPVNETYYPEAFGLAVIDAVKNECRARRIAVFE